MKLSIILISLCFVISLSPLGCDCLISRPHGYISEIRTKRYQDQTNRDERISLMNETMCRCYGKCGATENKHVYDLDCMTTIKTSMYALQRGLREEKRIKIIIMSKIRALQEENDKLNQVLKTMIADKTENINITTETLRQINENVIKGSQGAKEDRNKLMELLTDIQNLKQETAYLNLSLKNLNEKIKVENNIQIMSRIEMIKDENENLSQALAEIKEIISFKKGVMMENGKPYERNETVNQEMSGISKVQEVIKKKITVTHYPTNYKLDFNAAKTYCESRGTSIATYEDLDGAYKDGYEKCACGWAANGIAYLVMQAARQGCASSAGIFNCSWQSTWDVFCKRRIAPVTHYPTNYKLDFNAAKTYCESRGTSIATYEDLDGAYIDGYEKCACGWASNGIAYLVMQAARQGCASSAGIFNCSWQSTWDVFCKRRMAPVTHYPTNYKLDFNAAKTYCESRGTSIATYEDLDGAYKDGYEKCACGWAANGIAYLVMQAARQGCASSAGIFNCSWQSTWDVFCKRRIAPVTHYPTNYKLDFNAAKTYCESRGTSIATYEDLDGAYIDGYEKCACGWASNGTAYLVMQAARQGCASSAGIFNCSWQSTWDVFCKRRMAPVTHYPTNYKLDFNAAKTYCESRGTSIATYEDLDGAYKDGYEKCSCGWAANGIAYLVMQTARQGCSSSAGIFNCSWQSTWDVFCKRRMAPVTHYPTNYKLDFNAAKTYCESRGTSIATYEDLDGAYIDGYEKCACGWASNGTAYLVMQAARQGCASSAGIFNCSWQSTWDVFCKRRMAPVTHYPTNYKLDFNAAKTYCESRGTSIATYEDLDGAYKDGYEKCACGWAANGIAYLVMQTARQGCSSSAGIFNCSWQSTWDVFCKRRMAPVTHYPTNYKLDFNAAKTYCESRGTSIATYEDLDGAYIDGYEKCACGWASNGTAYLVMQAARQGCASSAGIFNCSWQSTWDVFCKRRMAPVTHYPTNYKLDFNAAKTYCESRGTSIATYEDLDGAYKDGYEKCACGWAANGIAYLVMQTARQGCSSSAGIFNCSWQSTWDVFCKRRMAPVTHYPTNYKLDFNAAKTYCESRGTSIATYEDLDGAYIDGYEKCACGWASNGTAYLVMQAARQGCASSAGIFNCSWQSTWDVFCKRRMAPVTHYPTNYKLDFNAAKTYCESRGTSIATYEDLDGAYKDGYEKCACGWAANGIAYLVMQTARQGCSSSAGIFNCSWQSTWDVFCKRRMAPVTHYPTNYKLDFNAAKTYCESRGTSIATYEDLDGAYIDGYEKCACGWASNGTAYLVMQAARQGCASSAGIFNCSWQSTWDVFCKRRMAPVTHYPTNYKLDFNAAKTYCESRGTSIATYEDLDGAYKDGYEKCACGWAANGIAYLVMQAARQGCSSSAGIFNCSWQSTWDVFCKRRVAPVTHYPTNYKLDFNAAKTYCESRGTSIATYEDLDGAYKDGYEKCVCGWAANGIAYLVMQTARQGCSSSAGIFNCSWQSTWDVFCKG